MANRTQIKFGRFKWNRAGYAELMKGDGVQSLLKPSADALALQSNADFGDSGYQVKPFRGRLAKGYVVRTSSKQGYYSELKHNRLLRGFKSIGGS